MFENNVKNQHYISVAEQRLNSCNPEQCVRNKSKILKFKIVDREEHKIELCDLSEIKAIKNLSFKDLYTFCLKEGDKRVNFEEIFQKYESDINEKTKQLIEEHTNDLDCMSYVFKSKLMSMIRNPYCIEKTINTFQYASEHYPTSKELKDYFDLINEYSVPLDILIEFSITEEKYKKWLKIIFIMLTPTLGQRCILDDFAEQFFDFTKFYHLIFLYKYTTEICLLSDRSYVDLSPMFEDANGVTFGFNLRKDAFIYMSFFPNDIEMLLKNLLKNNSHIKNLLLFSKINGVKQLQYSLSITRVKDDINVLRIYNKHVIYQSFESVFAASDKVEK